MNPEVAALLEELADDTQKASVTFFPMGIHTHLSSDGMGGWNLQVHSTVEDHETQQEEMDLLVFAERVREMRETQERAERQEAWVRRQQARLAYMPTNPRRR